MIVYYPQDIVLTLLYNDDSGYRSYFGPEYIKATRHNGYYKLLTSPRFTPNMAVGDLVKVEYEDEECYFREIAEESGYSVVYLSAYHDKIKVVESALQSHFKVELDVIYDAFSSKSWMVNIPPHIDYGPIKKYLDNCRRYQVLHFEETCIRKHHFLQSRPMCTPTFWELIQQSHKENKGLTAMLQDFTPLNIIEFENVLNILLHDIDTFRLRAALKTIKGSASDEEYLHFKCWIVAQGENFYREVAEQTDHLVHYYLTANNLARKELLSVARDAYALKTGKALTGSISGDNFDLGEEEYPTLFPRLWQKYRA